MKVDSLEDRETRCPRAQIGLSKEAQDLCRVGGGGDLRGFGCRSSDDDDQGGDDHGAPHVHSAAALLKVLWSNRADKR